MAGACGAIWIKYLIQLTKMTNEQINQLIAEACGWTDCNEYIGKPPILKMDQYNRSLPNYARCLNAMHEAVMTFSVKQRSEFRNQLQYLIASPTNVSGISHYDEWWHATARQRAEAFLRTIGKWEEEA
jgi:hypothetical protein